MIFRWHKIINWTSTSRGSRYLLDIYSWYDCTSCIVNQNFFCFVDGVNEKNLELDYKKNSLVQNFLLKDKNCFRKC